MKRREQLTDEHTTNYFDTIAATHGVNSAANADKYGVIRHLLKESSTHPAVLECGGGGGFYTQRLLRDGYFVSCIDLSEQALRENRRQAESLGLANQLTTVVGDFASNADKMSGQYDQVVFIKVLHHFPSLDAIDRAVTAGLSACKPGGRVVIFEPNGKNVLWKFFLSMVRDKVTGKTKWFYEQNLRLTTRANIEAILARRGATDAQFHYHYVLPGFVIEKNFPGAGVLRALNRVFERSFFRRLAFNIAFVIDVDELGKR